jgi:hypothetical protein
VGGDAVNFKPPIQLASQKAKKGDTWSTTTGGASWTSTFVGFEWCPVDMNVDWNECGHFVLTTDTEEGYSVAGDYWAILGYNVVAMTIPGDPGQWMLSDHDCAGDCNGIW